MRILIHADFFIQEDVGYLLTPTSRLLLKDESNLSMIPFLQVELDPIMMDPWKYLSKWFQNGDFTPSLTVHGKPFFGYTEKEPKLNRLFNKAIASDAPLVINGVIEHCKGIFEGLKSLVDLGGGTGTMA
ncbi:hypothetical protein HAX54_036943 [Datura stramonium]|uniref:O-methyltransferase C-terminal domain-containing protein n=1 Tax=Datura stramonium TaxID=4076 RepID=A0ABS8VKD9_DATST|nr:hypothetical protein [Datura stramonium]